MKQHILMSVLPECDIEGCGITATFDAVTTGHFKKYLCRTHYLRLGNKELPPTILKLTHQAEAEINEHLLPK